MYDSGLHSVFLLEEALNAMTGLEDHLVKVKTFVWNDDDFDTYNSSSLRALQDAASKCSLLHDLQIAGDADEIHNVLQAISPPLRSCLKVLNIDPKVDPRSQDIDLWAPANMLCSLGAFSFRSSAHRGYFSPVGRACPLLETVDISWYPGIPDPIDQFCLTIVEAFSCCKFLKDFMLIVRGRYGCGSNPHNYSRKVANVCLNYRTTFPSLYARLFGAQYLPVKGSKKLRQY